MNNTIGKSDVAEARRREGAKARRREGAEARKREGAKARRREGAEARKREGAKARKRGGAKVSKVAYRMSDVVERKILVSLFFSLFVLPSANIVPKSSNFVKKSGKPHSIILLGWCAIFNNRFKTITQIKYTGAKINIFFV